jgi:hypothetical protein
VQLSQEFLERMQNIHGVHLAARGEGIQVKGKGVMQTYSIRKMSSPSLEEDKAAGM